METNPLKARVEVEAKRFWNSKSHQ